MERPGTRLPSLRSLCSVLVAIVTLGGFPLFLADVALQYILQLRQETTRQTAFVRLDSALARISAYKDPEVLFPEVFTRLMARAEKAPDPVAWLDRRLKAFERKFPRLFTFTVFDRRDKVLTRGRPAEKQFLSEKLLRLIREYDRTRRNVFDDHESLMVPFLGCESGRNYRQLMHGTGWVDCSAAPRKTWFFYGAGKTVSLFVNIHKEGMPLFMGLARCVRKTYASGLSFLLVDNHLRRVHGPADRMTDRQIDELQTRYDRESRHHFAVDDRLCSLVMLDTQFSLLASIPDPSTRFGERLLYGFRWAGGLGLFLAFVLAVGFFLREPPPFVSIKWTLVGIFVLSTGIPLLILFLMFSSYIHQRRNALMYETWRLAGDTLQALDQKFRFAGRLCEDRVRPILHRYNPMVPKEFVGLKRELLAFDRGLPSGYLGLISSQGAAISFTENRNLEERRLFNSLLFEVLCSLNGAPVAAQTSVMAKAELMAGSMLGNRFSQFLNQAILEIGRVFYQEMGTRSGYYLLDVIRDPRGPINYLFTAIWEKEYMICYFLRENIPRVPLSDGTEIMVVRNEVKWAPRPRNGLRPGGSAYRRNYLAFPLKPMTKSMFRLVKEVLKTQQLTDRVVRFRGGKYLVTGNKASLLDGYSLFILKPFAPIDREIRDLSLKFKVFGVLSVGFTLLLGMFLARKILAPVEELGKGIEAVKQKEFRYVIPPQNPDELGLLAQMFNGMIESLYEASMGQVVQKRLFPQGKLEVGDYRVFGLSLPATQLGGDYFDYLQLKNGNLMVMLGDATGHGVPAALIMTMARSIVGTLRQSTADPLEILAALNQQILETMKKSLGMTMITLDIDPDTHQVRCFNCSHPRPLKKDSQGKITTIVSPGFMLGIRGKLTVTPAVVELLPGERLYLFTDGLAESLQGAGADGFDLFEQYIGSRPDLPLEESCRDILMNHPHVLAGVPQIDDLTVVLIERRPSSEETV